MKKGIRGLAAAAALGTAVFAMGMTASAATYEPKKSIRYAKQDGKWVKQSEVKKTYKSGRLTQTVSKNYVDGKVTESVKTVYTYKNGRLDSAKEYRSGKLTYSYKNTWKNGLLTKVVDTYYYDGKPDSYTAAYKYKNKKMTSCTIKSGGKVYCTVSYKYKGGKQVGVTTKYTAGGSSTRSMTYSKGKLSKEVAVSKQKDGSSWKTTTTYKYTYDSKTKAVKQVIETVNNDGAVSTYKTVNSGFVKVK